jgi:hypothetical protein
MRIGYLAAACGSLLVSSAAMAQAPAPAFSLPQGSQTNAPQESQAVFSPGAAGSSTAGSGQPTSASQPYVTGSEPNLPTFDSTAQIAPGTGRLDQRVPDLRFWACDGVNYLPRYTGRWQGDGFVLSRIDGNDTRTEQAINFVDWNMQCWTANWDAKRNLFDVRRLPQGRDEHYDNAIHFLAHDLTPWEAFREGQSWIVRPGRFEAPARPAFVGYSQQPGPYGQQPGPYGQQPGPYAQQPAAYPQQVGYSPQQQQPYGQQPMQQPQMGYAQPRQAPAYGY